MADEQVPLLGPDNKDGDSGMAMLDNNGINRPASSSPPPPPAPPTMPPATTSTPIAIAHRGYKAQAPENTMLAFRRAVDVDAGAIETDLHLSRDGVVVLSHDADLGRCYGLPGVRVRDRDWAELAALRTARAPHEPMPRLRDLLAWLDEDPRAAGVGVLLDIKRHDDAEELVRRTAETIASVPATQRPWNERITPCCWDAKYIRLCLAHLPGFRITHVGHSTAYARALVDQVPGLSAVSMLRHALAAPVTGPRFLRDMRARGVPVHAWTVNEEDWMEWCVRNSIAGVITDDPALFREVRRRVGGKEEEEGKEGGMVRVRGMGMGEKRGVARTLAKRAWFAFEMLLFHVLLAAFAGTTWLRHGSPRRRVREELRG
ncbi:PLC-like phosphodiesterase [Biscogniauxia mediterranea]|nr:PLC-like phosphodiesterase [Biscogniauxia mediterranea]